MTKEKKGAKQRATASQKQPARSCGLCGKSNKLTRTECCHEWICDDADEYKLFSYARNSCYLNHDKFTLCSFHYNEQHEGNDWQHCKECRAELETEMYVWYGTNEYNFVKLENPPKYKPTKCAGCKRVIKVAEDGYSLSGGQPYCLECSGIDFSSLLSGPKHSARLKSLRSLFNGYSSKAS